MCENIRETEMIRLKVREIATAKGYNIGKLSRAADVDRNTMKRMFDDTRYSPTVETLYKVAKVLHVSIADLIEEVND